MYKCKKCNSKVLPSQFQKMTGYESYKCQNKECNALYDKKDLIQENLVSHENLQFFEDLLNNKNINQSTKIVDQTINFQNNKINDLFDFGFRKTLYSLVTNSSRDNQTLTEFINKISLQYSDDILIIDPQNVRYEYENQYSDKLNWASPKTIEDAYDLIINNLNKKTQIIALNLDTLVSQDLCNDPHKKFLGHNARLHQKYLRIIKASNRDTVLFMHTNCILSINSTINMPTPKIQSLIYLSTEDFFIKDSYSGFTMRNRKTKKVLNIRTIKGKTTYYLK